MSTCVHLAGNADWELVSTHAIIFHWETYMDCFFKLSTFRINNLVYRKSDTIFGVRESTRIDAIGDLHKQVCSQSLVQSRQFVISTALYDHQSWHRKQAGTGDTAYQEGRALQKVAWMQPGANGAVNTLNEFVWARDGDGDLTWVTSDLHTVSVHRA